jgi:hypothetical protein
MEVGQLFEALMAWPLDDTEGEMAVICVAVFFIPSISDTLRASLKT